MACVAKFLPSWLLFWRLGPVRCLATHGPDPFPRPSEHDPVIPECVVDVQAHRGDIGAQALDGDISQRNVREVQLEVPHPRSSTAAINQAKREGIRCESPAKETRGAALTHYQ